MKKWTKILAGIGIGIIVVVGLVGVLLLQIRPEQENIYHTQQFDFTLDEEEGEYAYSMMAANAFTYPSKQPWMQVHLACFKNDIRKKPRFLGVGNDLCIGTIWQRNFISMRTTMDELHFNHDMIRRFTRRGNVSSCGTTMNINIGVDNFLNVQPNYFDIVNAELGFLLRKPKRTTVFVESFVPIDLLTGDLIAALDTCTDQSCKQYLRWFKEEGNLICTWTYEVNGVSVLVETRDTISADLKSKLQTELRSSPASGKLQTDFKYIDDRTIKIITHNPFYAIGGVQKITNVMEKKK